MLQGKCVRVQDVPQLVRNVTPTFEIRGGDIYRHCIDWLTCFRLRFRRYQPGNSRARTIRVATVSARYVKSWNRKCNKHTVLILGQISALVRF